MDYPNIQRKAANLSYFVSNSYGTQAAVSLDQAPNPSIYSDDECADIDWNQLGFGLKPTDYMYIMRCSDEEGFQQGQLSRYGNIELSPSAGVLNYGQGLFEGTKAYRREDGRLFLFRPDQNAIRMQVGAERMCMLSPSVEQFVNAVKQTALANRRWIPPFGKGSLYIRPLLMGSGPIIGLAPAPECTFLVYASPVGNYFKEGTAPLNLYVEDEFHRASRGGAGGVKSITNYAPVLKAISSAKSRGFSDVLYLDSVHKKNIEEVSSCNIFVVKGNVISTPVTNGTVLEGVTRKSIIEIANDLGYEVEQRYIPVEELLDADEVFCTGTAVGVAPVASITYKCNSNDECVDIDWNRLGFGLVPTDYMYIMRCCNEESFQQGQLSPYGNIELSPSAGVLNYGQGLLEGTKAYKREDGRLILFRPDQNAIRMQLGAERMCMPSPSIEQFVNAVKQTALANRRWIPPPGKGSLYIRPLLIGSGPILGLGPAPEYTFLVYASPVGNYFKEGTAPLNLYVEDEIHRASRGGAGGIKSITNYGPVMKAISRAKKRGFSDVIYLDSVHKKNIEEVSSCNIFIRKGNLISTPVSTGTILEGVTRKSIMEIANGLGYQVIREENKSLKVKNEKE
ncbi:hypothetical protein M9H77_32322 [Catharanthus roseus]|uniref:Uncharacterized protein n=1 Tax=Catharanthus roseus TaxID=4058 RepID=A0ACC0A2J0_CATRO|nr:hypothetical protein M9H77_32322 [Catharanthus roseus]